MFKSKFEMVGVLALAGMFLGGAILTIAIYSTPALEFDYTDMSILVVNDSNKDQMLRVQIDVFMDGTPIDMDIQVPAGPNSKLIKFDRFWTGSHTLKLKIFTNDGGLILSREIPEPVGELKLTVRIPKGRIRQ